MRNKNHEGYSDPTAYEAMKNAKEKRPQKSEVFNIRLTWEEKKILDRLSLETGLSKSDVIRRALRVYDCTTI